MNRKEDLSFVHRSERGDPEGRSVNSKEELCTQVKLQGAGGGWEMTRKLALQRDKRPAKATPGASHKAEGPQLGQAPQGRFRSVVPRKEPAGESEGRS